MPALFGVKSLAWPSVLLAIGLAVTGVVHYLWARRSANVPAQTIYPTEPASANE